jgi:hypothetical protein
MASMRPTSARWPPHRLVAALIIEASEIRGAAELCQRRDPLVSNFNTSLIRTRPPRIIAWNIDRPGYNSRVAT